jgi:hypothetical protein
LIATVVACHHGGIDHEEDPMADDIREFTVRLRSEDHRALKVHSALTGMAMNEVISRLVHDFVSGAARQEAFEAALASTRTDYREALDRLAQ